MMDPVIKPVLKRSYSRIKKVDVPASYHYTQPVV